VAIPWHTVGEVAPGTRLIDVAKQHLAVLAVDQVGPRIAGGAIARNGRPGAINDPVRAGDVLAVVGTLDAAWVPEPIALTIVDEDDDLLVIDKPAGMHVHPLGRHRRGTLLNALLWHAGARPDQPWAAWRPRPAHRLDRGASGLVVIAKHAEIHDALRVMLEAHAIERGYLATVHGLIAADAGTIDAPLGRDPANDYRRAVVAGGQPAVTHYRVVRRDPHAVPATTVLELTLATGRTHQIRAHLASLGHPIVGDALYGAAPREPSAAIELRAVTLRLAHPRDRRPLAWSV
jgi:23S rRNA pseudouridine1911/1915/1917 synthase